MQLSSKCFFAVWLINQVSFFRCTADAKSAYGSCRLFTCLCFISAMKKRRFGECFLPNAISNRVADSKSEQEKLGNAFKTLNSVDILGLWEKNLIISEYHTLLLLSSRLMFLGVVMLKFCLERVPETYSAVRRDTGAPIRFTFMVGITRKKGFMLSPLELQQYVQMLVLCPGLHWHTVDVDKGKLPSLKQVYRSSCRDMFKMWKYPVHVQSPVQGCGVWSNRTVASSQSNIGMLWMQNIWWGK